MFYFPFLIADGRFMLISHFSPFMKLQHFTVRKYFGLKFFFSPHIFLEANKTATKSMRKEWTKSEKEFLTRKKFYLDNLTPESWTLSTPNKKKKVINIQISH